MYSKEMNKKQNSLMKFSRSERLAQLSEQESVIERKKREIQAKLEAQKKKETEEALKKLESSKETKHNKADFSNKSSIRNRDEFTKEKKKEGSEKEEKQENLTNAFSNDGSFLDHFKKISSTAGLTPNSFDMKTFMSRKQVESDNRNKDERDIFKSEQEGYYEQRSKEKNCDRDRKDQESINTKQPYFERKFSEPNVQMPLPPPGVAQFIPQQQSSSNMSSTSQQNQPLVPLIQYPNQLMQSSGLNSVPSFTTNEVPLKTSPSSFIQTQPTLSSNQVPNIGADTKQQVKSSFNQLSSGSKLSSLQPPLPSNLNNIPSSLPSKETGKTLVPLIKNKLKEFETDSSSSEDELGYGKRFKRKQFRSFNSGDKSKQGSAPGSSMHYDSVSLPQTALRKEYSGVSPALYENDGDDEDEDDGLTETHHQLAELVARCGDDFEDSLRNKKENDPAVRFLSDKNSKQYLCYRKLVLKYRRNMKLNEKVKSEDFKPSTDKTNPHEGYVELEEKTFSKSKSECRLAKEDSKDSGNSQGENVLDKPRESKLKFDQRPSDSYQGNNEDLPYYKMPESTSKEEGFSFVQKQNCQEKEMESSKAITKGENGDETKTEEKRKRKRKSRWGDAVASSSNVTTPVVGPSLSLQPPGALPTPKTNLLSQLTRSDPGLIQYARQTFGSTNLSEEDWKKAEDHYKINLLYQNMVRKRAEIDKLEKAGKFKYEYDSDEDVEGGTWEHKLRQQEMMATQMWAEELTRQAAGKHHIGDFLPPEELERFMEKYNAVKEGREPDLSDYKEFKLKEDNVGYRLLQKMGWDEGQGLGQDGSGIKNPVNKATTRHENQGLGIERPDGLEPGDDEYDAYRKRMMLAYRFRPNPLNNPRRPYY